MLDVSAILIVLTGHLPSGLNVGFWFESTCQVPSFYYSPSVILDHAGKSGKLGLDTSWGPWRDR